MRRRRLLQATLAAGSAAAWPARAQAGRAGHALLVGNTSYNPREENLPPALKCLRDLEARLQRFGFEVVVLHDAAIAQVQAEVAKIQRAVASRPDMPAAFYFVGHGFQSNAENFLVPAGGDLQVALAQLSKTCISLEKEIFVRLKRPIGPAATVIMVDACRTPDRPRTPGEGYNQTLPPEGCHVAFATGPGKRAFAPNDPEKHTLFAEVLVDELDASPADRSILLTLESVRAKVANRVNSIPTIVRVFGKNAQEPELASNVSGDPPWAPSPASGAVSAPPPRSVRRRRRVPSSPRRARSARPKTRRHGCAPTWRRRRRATRPRSPSCACATWRRCCAPRGSPASTSMSPSSRQASGHGSPKTSAVRSRATSTRRCASPKRCRGPRPAAS